MYNRTYRSKSQHGKFVSPEDLLEEGLYGLGLEEELTGDDRLMEYITELMNWNRVYNLTSVRRPAEIVTRHILDSLSVIPHLNGDRILDIGTGAGLPGIPLAIACPEREFVLLDSSSKKLRFVQQTLGILELDNVTLEHTRIEDYRPDELFTTVICRAFSDLGDMYQYAKHVCAPDGRMLAMKGVYPMAEIEGLENKDVIDDVVSLSVPGLDADRHLVLMNPTTN
ncbi:MAG: 16S rRNA (guanine(527)-N(7))-methyltransferase RsmG [Gammaproteobacteria bacterium]|nr:16S rRNA (guanine(527)-N(7))-methyltransferase RsmG [Gammaproteobacteria bacterium]